MSQKDTSDWSIIAGGKATLTYELVSDAFNYELEATGLSADQDYSLIYYADSQDRYVDFGGDNPGALIAEVTADGDGNVSVSGLKNLAMNLPHEDDWNGTSEANYCDNSEGDNYELCRGAKVWLVPSSNYDESSKSITDWSNMADFLYETDLIVYDDSNTDGVALHLGKGLLNFFVKNVLNVALQPGDYKVKTEVQPVI
ncbi:hypothetical protein KKC45_00330 [Patescibacteria group bacterium]|nr:hypothetical protein [Patescibacteria group bacterium]